MKTPLTTSYPAVFTKEENGGYFIEIIDVPGAFTGINQDDITYGIQMAEEVLGMVLADMIESNEDLPTSTKIHDISLTTEQFVTLIKVDIEKYLKDMTLVKKTLTIPSWANERGIRLGINFSKLLTDAIAEESNKRFK